MVGPTKTSAISLSVMASIRLNVISARRAGVPSTAPILKVCAFSTSSICWSAYRAFEWSFESLAQLRKNQEVSVKKRTSIRVEKRRVPAISTYLRISRSSSSLMSCASSLLTAMEWNCLLPWLSMTKCVQIWASCATFWWSKFCFFKMKNSKWRLYLRCRWDNSTRQMKKSPRISPKVPLLIRVEA